MSRLWDLRTLVIVVVLAAGLGVLVDVTTDEVVAPASDIQAERGSFQTRASFCPPPFSGRFGGQTIALVADPGEPASIRIQPQQTESSELAEGRLLMHKVSGPAVEAVAYGSVLHAAALISMDGPTSGAGAARCPRVVSDKWYFPAGSSSLGYDERILVRNPFPDEAVVSVTFYTPTGKTSKANLAEVAVPAGESKFIKVNDFILRQPVLGASVTARRGRIVAWRAMFAEPDDRPDGVYFGLGATSPSLEWYFPEGVVGDGLEQLFTLLNPYRREAIVSITLATPSKPLQPPKLVEVRVPPEAIKTISLPGSLGAQDQDLGSVGATIESTNGIGVVAERTIWYAAGRTGVTSTIGAREPATQWVVPPAAVISTEDSVILLNPTGERATVDVTLLRKDAGAIAPETLKGLTVKAGARLRVDLGELTGGQPTALLVTSDQPIVAERVANAGIGDVSAVLGEATRTAP
jgi:hypothetical protein